MNKQEVYNKVRAHLLTQRARSVLADCPAGMACAYRGVGGLKCAIGCLIEDKHYDPEFERFGVGKTSVRDALRLSGVAYDVDFLSALQVIHDNSPLCQWEADLESVREKYLEVADVTLQSQT